MFRRIKIPYRLVLFKPTHVGRIKAYLVKERYRECGFCGYQFGRTEMMYGLSETARLWLGYGMAQTEDLPIEDMPLTDQDYYIRGSIGHYPIHTSILSAFLCEKCCRNMITLKRPPIVGRTNIVEYRRRYTLGRNIHKDAKP